MPLPISPAFEENNLAITLQTSEYFAPYASVTILSIIEQTSPQYNYDILVMTWDMQEETAQKLISMADGRDNISIRIIDVCKEIEVYRRIVEKGEKFERFSFVGIVRLIMPEMLTDFDVVLNLDCDMLVCADVSELFEYDLTEYYMGAVTEMMAYALVHCPEISYVNDKFIYGRLGLDHLSQYVSGGFLLLNLKLIRQDFSANEIIDFAFKGNELLKYYEQDAFSGLFHEKLLLLPPEWNWFVDSTGFIARGIKRSPVADKIIKNYVDAETKVKLYHFNTYLKPWTDNVTYSDIWWRVARKSPFLISILMGNDAISFSTQFSKKDEKRLLFFCETPYQLLNCLNIKHHYYPNICADLLMCKTTDIISYIDVLKSTNIFENIIVSEYDGTVDVEKIRELPLFIRSKHPNKYEKSIVLTRSYTDYFLPVLQFPYAKMIYYQMVNAGNIVNVHVYEEGVPTYTDDIYSVTDQDINHNVYSDSQKLINNIKSIFLYKPELYSGISKKVRKIPIPLLSEKDIEFCKIISDVFGNFQLPPERYLFFIEVFSEHNLLSNDIQILDAIASVVGKENIAVKLHPKSINVDKIYALHGYRIFSDKNIPWEVATLSEKLSDKVLISVSSNTIWTPFVIANTKTKAISFGKIMKLSRRGHTRNPAYQKFLAKVQNLANREQASFFTPNTLLELISIVRYLEGELR